MSEITDEDREAARVWATEFPDALEKVYRALRAAALNSFAAGHAVQRERAEMWKQRAVLLRDKMDA